VPTTAPTRDVYPPIFISSGMRVGGSSINFTLTCNEPATVNCTASPVGLQGLMASVVNAVTTRLSTTTSIKVVIITGLAEGVWYNVTCIARDVYRNTGPLTAIKLVKTLDLSPPSFPLRRLYLGPLGMDLVIQLSKPGNTSCLLSRSPPASVLDMERTGLVAGFGAAYTNQTLSFTGLNKGRNYTLYCASWRNNGTATHRMTLTQTLKQAVTFTTPRGLAVRVSYDNTRAVWQDCQPINASRSCGLRGAAAFVMRAYQQSKLRLPVYSSNGRRSPPVCSAGAVECQPECVWEEYDDPCGHRRRFSVGPSTRGAGERHCPVG
jgi:hypothetical protein